MQINENGTLTKNRKVLFGAYLIGPTLLITVILTFVFSAYFTKLVAKMKSQAHF